MGNWESSRAVKVLLREIPSLPSEPSPRWRSSARHTRLIERLGIDDATRDAIVGDAVAEVRRRQAVFGPVGAIEGELW